MGQNKRKNEFRSPPTFDKAVWGTLAAFDKSQEHLEAALILYERCKPEHGFNWTLLGLEELGKSVLWLRYLRDKRGLADLTNFYEFRSSFFSHEKKLEVLIDSALHTIDLPKFGALVKVFEHLNVSVPKILHQERERLAYTAPLDEKNTFQTGDKDAQREFVHVTLQMLRNLTETLSQRLPDLFSTFRACQARNKDQSGGLYHSFRLEVYSLVVEWALDRSKERDPRLQATTSMKFDKSFFNSSVHTVNVFSGPELIDCVDWDKMLSQPT